MEKRSGKGSSRQVRSRFNPHRWALRCIDEGIVRLKPGPVVWAHARAMG